VPTQEVVDYFRVAVDLFKTLPTYNVCITTRHYFPTDLSSGSKMLELRHQIQRCTNEMTLEQLCARRVVSLLYWDVRVVNYAKSGTSLRPKDQLLRLITLYLLSLTFLALQVVFLANSAHQGSSTCQNGKG
jgi:hypothetical protein